MERKSQEVLKKMVRDDSEIRMTITISELTRMLVNLNVAKHAPGNSFAKPDITHLTSLISMELLLVYPEAKRLIKELNIE